jgi:hypothetical protein
MGQRRIIDDGATSFSLVFKLLCVVARLVSRLYRDVGQHTQGDKMRAERFLLLSVAILGSAMQVAKADQWDQRTAFTFSGPVEIPGQVLLPGTYVFKLADSASDRNIVQVFNKDETHLFGTFLAIPDYRVKPADKTIITFEERAAGSPEAIKAWFYPGENYGHDFVYPKPKAMALAKANNTPVASMPAELEPSTTMPAQTMQEPQVVAMKTTPLKAQQPSEEEVDVAEVFAIDQSAPAPELPKTASNMPLIGIAGLLTLGAAFCLRGVRAKA